MFFLIVLAFQPLLSVLPLLLWIFGMGPPLNSLLMPSCTEVKSTWGSCRGYRFSFQHPHDGVQPSVIHVPEGSMPFPASKGTKPAHSVQTYIEANTHLHKIKFKKSIFILPLSFLLCFVFFFVCLFFTLALSLTLFPLPDVSFPPSVLHSDEVALSQSHWWPPTI